MGQNSEGGLERTPRGDRTANGAQHVRPRRTPPGTGRGLFAAEKHRSPDLYILMRYLTLVCLLCAAASAQSITRSRISQGFAVIKQAELKRDLDYLTSPALQGRLSLAKGSEEAAHWIANQFEKAGLKALGGSYLQPVPLIEFETNREQSGITVHRNGSAQAFHAPDAMVNFPKDLETSAPVVFAGFGITAPELDYDDYAGIDVHGK